MIVHLSRKKFTLDIAYQFTVQDTVICSADAPYMPGERDIAVVFPGSDVRTRLYFNPQNVSGGSNLAERLSFKVLEDDTRVGHIVGATMKTGKFFGGYPYYEFPYKSEQLTAYHIGFGSRGIYACLWNAIETVAIIDKELTVTNYQNGYTLYLADPAHFPAAALFAIYFDITCYGDADKIAVSSVQRKTLQTTQKELIAKFDPDFIPRVIAMEN